MGRVSKHRKVRACDPFYKGPRKPSIRKGDLPPSDDEQLPPKALFHLLNPIIRPKKKGERRGTVNNTESHSNKQNNKSSDSSCSDKTKPSIVYNEPAEGRKSPMFVRRPGESTKDYLERIDFETKIKVTDCLRREKKSDKRKRYLKERKKKWLSKAADRSAGEYKEFNDLKDQVKFGEVVQAPPNLSAKPRGSQLRKRWQNTKLLLSSSSQDSHPVVGLKEEHDMAEERLKIISQYRLAKKLKTDRTV